MRCIAVDDESLALELLKSYIARVPFLELDGVFANPFEAMEYLARHEVDLMFADIEMNDISGVQLISSLRHRPLVIFVTAYERYAIDGFALDAVDYLLKPVTFERFLRAVNKAFALFRQRERPEKSQAAPAASPVVPASDHLFVKSDNRLVKIFLADILYVEGYGDYIKIHLASGKTLLSLQNMGDFEARLPGNHFARVHRSYIVAVDKIEEIERKRIRIGKELIPVSETYWNAFYDRLNN